MKHAAPNRGRGFVTLDGLRGVAALSVVAVHCDRAFGDLTWASISLAVDLFFVLSGFVLAHAYEAKLRNGSTAFLKTRWIRLFPLYILGTALGVFLALLAIRYETGVLEWTWSGLLTILPFALVMLPAPGTRLFLLDPPMWSVFFELVVNVIWTVVWRPLQSTRNLVLLVACSGVGLVLSTAYFGPIDELGRQWSNVAGGLFRVCYPFFLGVLLYRFHDRWVIPKVSPLALYAALLIILFLPLPPLGKLLAGMFVLPSLVLLGSATQPKASVATLSHQLGEASYGVYALHLPIYRLVYAAAAKMAGILRDSGPGLA